MINAAEARNMTEYNINVRVPKKIAEQKKAIEKKIDKAIEKEKFEIRSPLYPEVKEFLINLGYTIKKSETTPEAVAEGLESYGEYIISWEANKEGKD